MGKSAAGDESTIAHTDKKYRSPFFTIAIASPKLLVGAGLADISEQKQIISQQNPPSPMLQPQNQPKKLPEILRGFKTFAARRINQMRHNSGIPVWQRNYYEHIIRNEESLQYIRQYIINNPFSWELDQLHPNNPSKW